MKTRVEFKSNKFPSHNDDTEGLNYSVGIYGKRLAEYLQEKLPIYGVKTNDAFAEDWGWCIEIAHKGNYFLSVGCGSFNEESSDGGFLCFITPNKPYIRKWFKKIDVRDDIKKVFSALSLILSKDPEIYDVLWQKEKNNDQ